MMKKTNGKRESFQLTFDYCKNLDAIMSHPRFIEWTKSQIIRHAIRELARRVTRKAKA
jgi:hypothetical protein